MCSPKSVQSDTATPRLAKLKSAIVSPTCSKCGTAKRSGKRSCCARGGAWFKNCGDVGKTQFDHTWVEGIQACKGVAASLSVKSPLRFNADEQNTNYSRNNNSHDRKNIFCGESKSGAGTVNSEVDTGVAKVAVWICLLLLDTRSSKQSLF